MGITTYLQPSTQFVERFRIEFKNISNILRPIFLLFRDILSILKHKATNSLRISCLFVSLGTPQKIRFDGQNGGSPN